MPQPNVLRHKPSTISVADLRKRSGIAPSRRTSKLSWHSLLGKAMSHCLSILFSVFSLTSIGTDLHIDLANYLPGSWR